MAQFIVNPRRAPRAPVRCRATVVCAAGTFEADTEDIGPSGCQLVSPVQVRKGDVLELVVESEQVPAPLRIRGAVAWSSSQAPWRAGVAFEESLAAVSGRWFERLVAASPGLGTFHRVPDRIPLDAMLYLGPPPRFVLDFTVDEAALLRVIASGVRLDELQARLRADWPSAQRALFSLMARHVVTLSRGQAAHPSVWKKIIADVEAALAVESLDGAAPTAVAVPPPPRPPLPAPPPLRPAPTPPPLAPAGRLETPPPLAPAPAPTTASRPRPQPAAAPHASGPHAPAGLGLPEISHWGVPARDPHPLLELPELPDDGAPLDLLPFAADPTSPPEHGAPGAGPAWQDERGARRSAGRGRSAEAQAALDRARSELEHGNVSGATSLLRRALALAPGDAEIADAIGRLALRDREPGER
jgi:hypothetical protein